MSHAITMPALSDTMSNGRLVKWTKKPGDAIKKGDVIAEIETDKAVMDVEAFEDGYLSGPLTAEGTEMPVGEVIGYIADSVKDVTRVAAATVASPAPATDGKAPAKSPVTASPVSPVLAASMGSMHPAGAARTRRPPVTRAAPEAAPATPPQIRRRRRWRRGRRIALNAPPACARPSPAT